MIENQSDFVKQNFLEYLSNLGLSAKSHKNYRSDLSHFSEWAILKIRSFGSYIETLAEAVPFLSKEFAAEYKEFLLGNKIPIKTINRRLSTLRHLSRYLSSSHALGHDFMDGIENASLGRLQPLPGTPIVEDFRSYLEASRISKSTVKNYVSDIRQFLAWLEVNNQTGGQETN